MSNKVIQLWRSKVRNVYLFFDVELTNQQGNKVRNNNVDEVTIIQATEEWTRFCNTLVMNMFASYQATENFI